MKKRGRLRLDLVAFCEGEHPRLVGALSLYCGDSQVAEELAQEAIATAIRDWPKLSQTDVPAAWLYRVALNLANSNFRRRAAERRANERLKAVPQRIESPEDRVAAAAVRAAVAGLPRRQRQALVLRYFMDLPVARTAELMECSEGTVKALTHQAVENLRLRGGLESLRETSDAL